MIDPEDTAGDVHDKLMNIGAEIVVQTVEDILEENIELRIQKSFIQGSEVLKPAPKLTRELCHIDWNGKTKKIHNLVRGLSPYPAAFTELTKDGKATQMKIFKTERITGDAYTDMLNVCNLTSAVPGTVLSDGRNFLAITTEDGALSILELQLAGKKRLPVKEFLIGFRDPMSYGTTQGTSSQYTEF
jgi:methionyl-tRNA formyltransferase